MATYDLHMGDIGTVFEVTVRDSGAIMDISAATTLEIVFKKPDGSSVTNSASLSTTGIDGKMRYVTTLDTDLDQEGTWSLQARIVTPLGDWRTSIDTFFVQSNI